MEQLWDAEGNVCILFLWLYAGVGRYNDGAAGRTDGILELAAARLPPLLPARHVHGVPGVAVRGKRRLASQRLVADQADVGGGRILGG